MISIILSILVTLGSCQTIPQNQASHLSSTHFQPGKIWPDTDNTHINAHGGGILVYDDTYYWFGEHKTSGRRGNQAHVGIRCYSSTDLYNWKNEGVALSTIDDPSSEITPGCVMERPKVIYNEVTGKFVMWFHLELKGQGYSAARTAVAVSDQVTGPYEYLESFRVNAGQWPMNFPDDLKNRKDPEELESWTPEWIQAVRDGLFVRRDFEKGQMSRDMTLFVDDNGKAYHIHTAEENLTLHISELTDNYLGFTGKWIRVLPAGHNEAPAIFKHNGKYFMITSGCTGWRPNEARSAMADSIWGPWEPLGNPCTGENSDLTFYSQSTFVLPVRGMDNAYIFMADRWRPENPVDGRYVWLPIEFEKDRPVIRWYEEWDLSFFN
jgi:beta-xylosidase